ncbi:hypothetical protein PF004_g17350 [Phytophthora fragariae]|nr:hypothetical protein PF004_g17350 [Phytophthora fragariae]
MGVNDKQWKVRIKADGCPKKLRETAVIRVEEVELVVHHHEIFINWPCKICYAPGHPTKFCKADEAQAAQLRKVHKHLVKGKLPSNKGQSGRNYSAADLTRTLEQLTELLKVKTTKNREEEGEKASKAANAVGGGAANEIRRYVQKERPTIPREWAQHSPSHRDMPKPETHSPTRESSYKTATANTGGETAKCMEDGDKEVLLQDEVPQATSTAGEEVEMSTLDGEVDMEMESMETEGNVPSVADRSVTSPFTQEARGRPPAPKETSSSEMMHKTRLARGISLHTRISISTKQSKRSAEGSRGTGTGLPETESGRGSASLSPKRKVPDDWDAADREETGGKGQVKEGLDPVGKTRSSSPAKRYKGGQGKKEKEAQQSYMHQFLQQIQTKQSYADKDEKTVVGSQVTSHNVKLPGDQQRVDRESSEVAKQNRLEKDGFQITGVKAADESSEVLDTWLAVLGGTVVDVAANGQCGWLACYAAVSNVQDGLMNPTAETT